MYSSMMYVTGERTNVRLLVSVSHITAESPGCLFLTLPSQPESYAFLAEKLAAFALQNRACHKGIKRSRQRPKR